MRMMKVVVVWVALVTSMYGISQGIRPSGGKSMGMLIVQDILYRPKSSPIHLALRYALFDTESYNSRIYSFENNALYVFSVPANYYQGSRAYVLFRLKFLRRFDLWIKYGVRIFSNRQSLGTGPEKIDGNRKTDLTVQLRMKF